MTTYIRYRISTDKIPYFKQSISDLSKKIYPDGLITGFVFSQCISEEENFIFRITWDTLLIEKNKVSDKIIENTLIALLDFNFKDFILEMRNYKTL